MNTLLETILAQPTAPFREGAVISLLTHTLTKAKVPFFLDPIGNVVVGVSSEKAYRKLLSTKSTEPVRLFIAHMDHPGFHGVKWRTPGVLEFKWHGGSPTAHLEGAEVWLSTRSGWNGKAKMTEAMMHPSGRLISHGAVTLSSDAHATDLSNNLPDAVEIFGGFGFRATSWIENDCIYTKAADDLVGVYSIITLAMELYKKKASKGHPFIGLITRAEEVGFIGAIGHFELGWFKQAKRPLLAVSLETSRALPGAEIGKGPIVRLGDRATVFDSGATQVFTQIAQKVLPGKFQRRIMDGGSCEGTAATAYGLTTIAISVPLGNYHNQCFEGGPDSRGPLGPAPEFVHLQDVDGLLKLCRALMKPNIKWSNPWEEKLKGFKKSLKEYRPLLRSGP